MLLGLNWENSQKNTPVAQNPVETTRKSNGNAKKTTNRKDMPIQKFIAMDCEMVGIGENGVNDMLARVSIVDQNGNVLLDKFVKPQEKVIDYRTKVSGIRPQNIENGEEFRKVQNEVVQLLQHKRYNAN